MSPAWLRMSGGHPNLLMTMRSMVEGPLPRQQYPSTPALSRRGPPPLQMQGRIYFSQPLSRYHEAVCLRPVGVRICGFHSASGGRRRAVTTQSGWQ